MANPSAATQKVSETEDLRSRYAKLVNNAYCADIAFLVGVERKKMFAHKLIITTASEVLNIEFNGSFDEAHRHTLEHPVVVPDIGPDAFIQILRFMYCGVATINPEVLVDLYYGSQKYLLSELSKNCETFIKSNLDEQSVSAVFQANRKHEFDIINESCLNIYRNNPLKCFRLKDFLAIDVKSLQYILSLPEMNCQSAQLMEATEAWLAANRATKNQFAILRKAATAKKQLFCLKVMNFDGCHFTSELCTRMTVTCTTGTLTLYGLGVFVGTDSTTASEILINFKVDIDGVSPVHIKKEKIPVSKEVYVHDLMFEELRFEKGKPATIIVTFEARGNSKWFCLNNFNYISTTHPDLQVNCSTPNRHAAYYDGLNGCYSCGINLARFHCFVAHLMYNIKTEIETKAN